MNTTGILKVSSKDDHMCTSVCSKQPDNFRLAKTPDGELILQGCFTSRCMVCSWSKEEWVDLPTLVLPAPPKPSRWQDFCKFVRSFLPKAFSFRF